MLVKWSSGESTPNDSITTKTHNRILHGIYIIVLQYTHVLCALLLSIGRNTVAIKTTPRLFYLSVSDKVATTYTSLLLSIFQYLAIYSYTASPVIDLPVVCTDFHLKNTYDLPLCPERLTNKFKLTWWYIYAFRCKKKNKWTLVFLSDHHPFQGSSDSVQKYMIYYILPVMYISRLLASIITPPFIQRQITIILRARNNVRNKNIAM